MSVKRGGLGRNLSALLGHPEPVVARINPDETPDFVRTTLAITCMQPGKFQPRSDFDDNALADLAESIKQQGLLQPLLVRALSSEQYEIIAGERRWRACQIAGMTTVPVVVRDVDDETAMAMALIENLQREDLNAMDQARAMQRLVSEFGLTHQKIAELLCKSRTAVSNYLRLLHLNADVRRMLEHGDLDMGHARCLLMLDEHQQTQVAQLVAAKGLSVRETESLVARVKAGIPSASPPKTLDPRFTEQVQSLARQLQTKIKLKPGKAGNGTLIIHYNNEHNLEKMIGQLIG